MPTEHREYDAIRLDNQVCFPLYACTKELVRQYTPYLGKLGLTYTQYLVMMVLWEKENVSSKELARCLRLDYGTLTPVLRRLQQAEYIKKERSSEDERLLALTLTEKGRALRDSAISIPTAVADCMGLSEEEFKTLYTIAYKALDHMENRSKGEEQCHQSTISQ